MGQKILVVGCPGSGKSTLSRTLQKKTGLPLHHLDLLWHKADKTTYSREEFDQKLRNILETDRWIIDGNYMRTMEMRLQACDTVLFLDYPTDICLAGAKARIGTKRDDLPWMEEELDPEFEQWILDFATEQRPILYRLLQQYPQPIVHIFHARSEAAAWLAAIQ